MKDKLNKIVDYIFEEIEFKKIFWLIYCITYIFKYIEEVNVNTLFIVTGVYIILSSLKNK